MLNSMYSGIAGLGVNQKKLDVVGNNIANSGTTAFKSSSITFQDSLYQSVKSASSASLNLGGTNPSQVGMGVSVQAITVNYDNQGSLQPTGRPYDLAIDQTGYFVVAKGPQGGAITVDATTNAPSSTEMDVVYTRDGAFKLDSEGRLVNSSGYRVMGYAVTDGTGTSPTYADSKANAASAYVNPDAAGFKAVTTELKPIVIPETVSKGTPATDISVQSFSIEKDGLVKAVLADGSSTVLGQVAMASFNNQNGLMQNGNNTFVPSSNSGTAVIRDGKNSGKTNDNSKAYGDMCQGYLEMSNVDLASQFTDMIVATRSFQACGKVITTGDEILQDLVNLKR